MGVKSFEDLDVFNRAYRLSIDLHRLSLMFPKIEQYGGLGDQLRRSSKSVCSNLVEGFGRQGQSMAEFRRFLMIAIGSADETRLWLRYCLDLGYVNEVNWAALSKEYEQIARMLQGLRRNSGPRASDS